MTVGEETELYYWSGTEWLPKILKVDTTKLEKLFNDTQVSTNQAIAQANAKAEEALKKAGTLPDMPTLSEQIKQQILSSPDLNRKVTESLNQTDSGVIYSKIYQNIKTDFVEQNDINQVLTSFSDELQAQVVEFNKLTESNKLYERIIGTSETDAPDKLSRLVMGSQIFQTEVGQYMGSEINYLRNSNFGSEGKFWSVVGNGKFNVNYQHSLKNLGKSGAHIFGENVQREFYGLAQKINYVASKNDKIAISFELAREGTLDFSDVRFGLHFIKDGVIKTQKWNTIALSDIKPKSYTRFEFIYDIPVDTDSLNIMFYGSKDKTINIYVTNIKVENNSKCSPWTPNMEDIADNTEATRTQMTQLAGSWAVKNLNSNGDVLNSINVLADGSNRIDGRLTHITGQTVIDEAVIDSANLKKVSASKLSGGEADFAKMTVVNFDAKNVTSGTFTGLTFRGGLIEGLNDKMNIDLQNSQINILDNDAGINRQKRGFPLQFIRMINDDQITDRGIKKSTLTIIGSNRDGTGVSHNSGFAGFRTYNSATDSLSEVVGDQVLIMSNNSKRSPWIFKAADYTDNHHRLIPSNENGTRHSIGRSDRRLSEIHVDEIYINGVRLKMALKDMLNRMGYRGTGNWGDNVN